MTETISVLARSEALPPLVLRISVTTSYRTATSRALYRSITSFDLATVGDVLFFDRFFRQVEVELEDEGDRQGSKNDDGGQHDDFLSWGLSGLGFGTRAFAFVEVDGQDLRDEDRSECQGDDSE